MTFEEWVRARGGALLRFALMVSADPSAAEDLVQSVLARMYGRWNYVSGLDSPEAYVKASIVNEHLRWWRRHGRHEFPAEITQPERVGTDIAGRLASRDAAWELLARLPRRQRAVLALRYYEDLSDDEIATVLGCSAGTVRSQASRALATLRAVAPTVTMEALP